MTGALGSQTAGAGQSPGGAMDLLLLSIWCGLTAGLLEVAARMVCRTAFPTGRLYLMSRHFLWLTPLANLAVFLTLGLLLAGVAAPLAPAWRMARPQGTWRFVIVPALMVAVPQVLPLAWFILALGIAWWVVTRLERNIRHPRQFLRWNIGGLFGVVAILAGAIFGGDWLKRHREDARARPAASCPNVLLVVMDTVRADHLSLYGYERATTPALDRLAKRGVRFESARATAPWTLPSHASFFTGRWPHELNVQWMTPLQTSFPMLAEYLGTQGYATAGFVANAGYCSYETGLDRGFTHYEDYTLVRLGFLRISALVDRAVRTLIRLDAGDDALPEILSREFLTHWFYSGHRRDAAAINRAFLSWLDQRAEPARPFFVFLNYFDAHVPYKLPEGATPRFGGMPETRDERRIVYENWVNVDKVNLPLHYVRMARDAYDNCLAYLDDQLGSLFGELERRGALDAHLGNHPLRPWRRAGRT